jgi:hypothetical protein
MKTVKLTGYNALMHMTDLIYTEVVSKGLKIRSETELRELFKKRKVKFNGEFTRAAESLGFITRKPYILWKLSGPMTGDHIKQLLVRIHENRMHSSSQYRDLYTDHAPVFPVNTPDCIHHDVYEELARILRTAPDAADEDIVEEPVQSPKIARKSTPAFPVIPVPEIEAVVTKSGISISIQSKGLYLTLEGKVSLKFDM